MKQTLQLKLGQSLTMTPQLQQAIKLLQLPTLELQAEIQQIMDSNPMLESEEEFEGDVTLTDGNNKTGDNDRDELFHKEGQEEGKVETLAFDEINAESPWQQDWKSSGTGSGSKATNDDRDIYETTDSGSIDLQEHLIWQINLSHMSKTDCQIAEAIIDAIDEYGYLKEDLSVIHASLPDSLEIEMDEIEAVLHRIQHMDPIGVGARNPSECLDIQLNTYSVETPGLALAKEIVLNHIDLLAAHDYARLKKLTGANDEEIQHAESLIRCLTPKPGLCISSTQAEYIVPDVFVSKVNHVWRVELNPDLAPKLRINSMYANMIRHADKSQDNNYLKSNLQEARWFLKSLISRNDTILKVATNIVERQRAFLEYGDEAMKPLVLRDIADTLGMHESTISRVTNQKYMHTPRGIFEFKYFFSSHVGTADGGECSATAIRAMIKKLIAAEDTRKPLSDSKIADVLGDQGINVARRTVAKYREGMMIAPSNERKRLA